MSRIKRLKQLSPRLYKTIKSREKKKQRKVIRQTSRLLKNQKTRKQPQPLLISNSRQHLQLSMNKLQKS